MSEVEYPEDDAEKRYRRELYICTAALCAVMLLQGYCIAFFVLMIVRGVP
jgi:hypothetical protein